MLRVRSAYKIPRCGVMMVCVADIAPIMVERAVASGKKNIKLLEYPETGHLIDLPHSPFNKAMRHPLLPQNRTMDYGGQLQSHSLAQKHAWTETLQFFKQHL